MPLLVCWNSTGKQFNPKTLYFKQNDALMWLSFDLVLVSVPLSIQKIPQWKERQEKRQQILPFITHITFLNKNAPLNSSCIDILQYQFRKRIMKQTSNKNKFSSSLIKNITILTSYNTNNILNTLYSKGL